MTKADYVRNYISSNGMQNSPARTIARELVRANPEMFTSVEQARSTVRKVRKSDDKYSRVETASEMNQLDFADVKHGWAKDKKGNSLFFVNRDFENIKGGSTVEKTIKGYIEDVPKFKFSHFTPKHKTGSGVAQEMALLDAHFGKLAWIGETGYRNYDTILASQDYQYAIDKSLNWSAHEKLEKIFFIVGQDLFHVDNMKNNTTNGDHAMDVDGRIPKIYRSIFRVITESIYKCRSVAPVEVIWNPGNHDYLASMSLCFALEQHFKDDKFVSVDIDMSPGPITRKARLWGNLLVGWTHRIKGRENTWGNELAQAFPKLWGESKFREWHCGDQHLKKTQKLTPQFTSGGVVIRQLTALSPVDKWHFENLFTDAVPGGESFLWSKDVGVYANYMAWTGQYENYRQKLIQK